MTLAGLDEVGHDLCWADGGRFEVLLRSRNRFPTEKLRRQAQEQIEAARRVYSWIIRDAK